MIKLDIAGDYIFMRKIQLPFDLKSLSVERYFEKEDTLAFMNLTFDLQCWHAHMSYIFIFV